MGEPNRNVSFYGTAEPPQALREVNIGSLSLLYSHESLRRLTWRGTELVRGITWPIRDANWGTYSAEILDEQIEYDADRFNVKLRFSVADGRLDCLLNVAAESSGEVTVDLTMTPVDGSFSTNRAGLTVLHPINGIAGNPLSVTHSDGKNENTKFPGLISFDQPVMDIQRLNYSVGDKQADITFDGEIFEMEDQRNWSDASYKTYCVPLVFPFTYTLESPITQSIHLKCTGGVDTDKNQSNSPLSADVSVNRVPQVGLVVQPGWTGDTKTHAVIGKSGVTHFLMRVGSEPSSTFLSDCANLSTISGAPIDAEIVLDNSQPVADALLHTAESFSKSGVSPERVLALPAPYLQSHQPTGPWPEGPTPSDVCKAARSAFPMAKIGAGMMTNFTELNRCRPDPDSCDYISHANTAIVHAGDDLSVLETLETLPQVFESAEALAAGKPYRLGLVSIGMRSNPYGEDVAENPTQIRRTMAREDPRQRGLFGAAWAVGVLAATEGSAVETLCLAAPTGPFGIAYTPQDYPQIGFDGSDALVYPLYHVVHEACRMAGAKRLSFSSLPDGLSAFGAQLNGDKCAMLANVTDRSQSVSIAQTAEVVMLDTHQIAAAVSDEDWLENAERESVTKFTMEPFAIAFLRWSD